MKNPYKVQKAQTGGSLASSLAKLTPALSKIGDVAKTALTSDLSKQLAKTAVEVGANVAANKIADKIAGNPDVANVVAQASNVASDYQTLKEEIKNQWKAGLISDKEAVARYKNLKIQFGINVSSGKGKAMDYVNKIALKQMNNGQYYTAGAGRYCPAVYPRPAWCYANNNNKNKTELIAGSGLPAALPAAALGAAGLGVLTALLSPILEATSRKFIASKI